MSFISSIPLEKVDSSNIYAIGYDALTNTARVAFHDGTGKMTATYDYFNITQEKYTQWRLAESLGKFLAKEIKPYKDLYPYKKVERVEELKLTTDENTSKVTTHYPLLMYVVTDHPKDFPDKFVVRMWEISSGQFKPTLYHKTFDTLADVRKEMISMGKICFTRDPDDDMVIVETWI